MAVDVQALFERRMSYPHPGARERLARLVGIDRQKEVLTKILGLLVHPWGLKMWGEEHHPGAGMLIDTVLLRPPLVILVGDVGSGKTELAETIGHAVAQQEMIEVVLLPLSLAAYVGFILIPAWTAYGRWWERFAAAFLTLYILAALVGIGAAIGLGIIYTYDEWAA